MSDSSDPGFDPRDLRRAFGNFATGVTIVTTLDPDGNPCGFTANSFTSVSIDPPLLLISIANSAYGCEVFRGSDGFAVNILAQSQRDLSNRFARAGVDKFAGVAARAAVTGAPILQDVVAWFDCAHHEQVEAGDHVLLIGRVRDYGYNTQAPLGFCRGAYVSYGLTPAMLQLLSTPGSLRVGAIIEAEGKILLERHPESGQLLPPACDRVGAPGGGDGLLGKLASAGIEVDLPFIYAAYQEKDERFVYYLGELHRVDEARETERLRFYDFDHITREEIGDSAILVMLERFIREKRLGNYNIYIGDRQSGEIHPA